MDLLSFEKGIAVAPVFWVAFGAIVYGLFCAGKQLALHLAKLTLRPRIGEKTVHADPANLLRLSFTARGT